MRILVFSPDQRRGGDLALRRLRRLGHHASRRNPEAWTGFTEKCEAVFVEDGFPEVREAFEKLNRRVLRIPVLADPDAKPRIFDFEKQAEILAEAEKVWASPKPKSKESMKRMAEAKKKRYAPKSPPKKKK